LHDHIFDCGTDDAASGRKKRHVPLKMDIRAEPDRHLAPGGGDGVMLPCLIEVRGIVCHTTGSRRVEF
jgi:hypothetical protein